MKTYVISANILFTNFSMVAFVTKVTIDYMVDNMIAIVSFVTN
jgi:hypothetical protein